MFYSHEVLTSSQYGVATIWLVATVGKGSQRRLNRKTIQKVNVPRACEKILDPGAPLALRLQGNLLYGVSRVFLDQCNFVLLDAEKTQSDMMTFFRSLNMSALDPKAGKTKLDELFSSEATLNLLSQESVNKYSQLSPLDHSRLPSASTSRQSSLIAIDLPASSHSIGSYRLPDDLRDSSPVNKAFRESGNFQDFRPFDDEMDPLCSMDLDFDANGNLISVIDAEPELPPMHGTSSDPLHGAGIVLPGADEVYRQRVARVNPEDPFGLEEPGLLPDDDPSERHTAAGKQPLDTDVPTLVSTASSSSHLLAPRPSIRRRRFAPMVDEELRISRDEFRSWADNYMQTMSAARQRRTRNASLARARKVARLLVHENGISGVGSFETQFGLAHPLAADFAGLSLMAHLSIAHVADTRGRRRPFTEAFPEKEEDGNVRNVKRLTEIGLAAHVEQQPDVYFNFEGDETGMEMGMDAAPALDDRNSSSLMPWSRHGSAAPPSATRASSSVHNPAPSPLHPRRSIVSPLHHRSDNQESLVLVEEHVALDPSSHNFWDYIADRAAERDCIEFEELANPALHGKHVAAQAFLHILGLATKGLVAIKQYGIENNEPFGVIQISIASEQHPSTAA